MLKGGTAGQQSKQDESGSNFGSFTHAGVKTLYASPKKTLDVRILPAFDMSLNLEDEAFQKSFVSYRDANEDPDEETGTPAFASWFYMVYGHTYFGLGRRQFLSPLTGTQFYPAGYDPIRDCWKYIDEHVDDILIKQLAHGKTVIDPVSKKEKKLPGYLAKTPRQFAMMNVLVEGDTRGVWDNAVLIVSQTTMRDLKDLLSKQTPRSDQVVITKEWEDYFYGDITDPAKGCIIRLQEKHISNAQGGTTRTSGFFLEQAPEAVDNHRLLDRPVTEEELMKRYRIFDTEKVTNLLDKDAQYQLILDYLVEDGVIPLEVLEVACGKYGTIKHDLRLKSASWFEGEPPVEGAGQSVPVAQPARPAQNALTQPSSAPAVDALAARKKETEDVVNEDVPLEDEVPQNAGTELDNSAQESNAPKSGVTTEAKARFQELQAKLQAGSDPMSAEELQELGELARAGAAA